MPDPIRGLVFAPDQRGMFLSISTFGLMLGALTGGRPVTGLERPPNDRLTALPIQSLNSAPSMRKRTI